MTLMTRRPRLLSGHLRRLLPAKTPGSSFSSLPFPSLLRLCREPRLLQQVHARFVLHGLHQHPTLCSDLVTCYAQLGRLDLSRRVFDHVRDPDVSLFSAMCMCLSSSGGSEGTLSLYRRMLRMSLYPDEMVYPFVIKSCSTPSAGEAVHCHVLKLGFHPWVSVGTALAEMYGELGDVGKARELFDTMPHYCNSLMSRACSVDPAESFRIFENMRSEGLVPDSATIVALLHCCIDLRCLDMGKSIHVLAVVSGLAEDLSLATTLLTMYFKFGGMDMARLVFESIQEKDTVAWNVMISGYSHSGLPAQALELLTDMVKTGVTTDAFTAVASLSSAVELRSLQLGKQIHGHVIRNESGYQVSVHNSLIEMYSRCQNLESARRVFDLIMNKTVISWSSMIKGYVNHGCPDGALYLFDYMKVDGIRPDSITVINILPACVHLATVERVETIHGTIVKDGLNSVTSVVTALLVAYAKCGCIEMAHKLFDEEDDENKDIVSWNSMINAYSKHGNWSKCFELYIQMKNSNLLPDHVTFLGLLTACVNAGLVKEGQECFNQMVHFYGYQPEQEHYACMVDLLGRAGHLREAMDLIKTMPFEPDALVWGPLLSACKLHSETRVAEYAAERLIDKEPKNPANYVLLSNIYAAAGKWEGVAKMRSFLKGRGLKKTPGYSWLEISGRVHQFCVADRSHPESEDIYTLLRTMEMEFKADSDNSMEFIDV